MFVRIMTFPLLLYALINMFYINVYAAIPISLVVFIIDSYGDIENLLRKRAKRKRLEEKMNK